MSEDPVERTIFSRNSSSPLVRRVIQFAYNFSSSFQEKKKKKRQHSNKKRSRFTALAEREWPNFYFRVTLVCKKKKEPLFIGAQNLKCVYLCFCNLSNGGNG